MAKERWLPIPGFEGYYEVSDQGRVRSVDRIVETLNSPRVHLKGRLLKASLNTKGYRSVQLHRNNIGKHYLVCHLVLTTFVGPRPPGAFRLHNDDDRLNDCLSNLRYGTSSDNARDRIRNGRNHYSRRTHCKNGHEFTPENTYQKSGSHRVCRECRRISARKSYRIHGKIRPSRAKAPKVSAARVDQS